MLVFTRHSSSLGGCRSSPRRSSPRRWQRRTAWRCRAAPQPTTAALTCARRRRAASSERRVACERRAAAPTERSARLAGRRAGEQVLSVVERSHADVRRKDRREQKNPQSSLADANYLSPHRRASRSSPSRIVGRLQLPASVTSARI